MIANVVGYSGGAILTIIEYICFKNFTNID
jgi:hypothetical protein